MTTAASQPGTSPIGAAYDPLGAHRDDPYPLLEQARQQEPVFWSEKVGAWVVTRYDDVLEVLRNTATFSSANALRPMIPLVPQAYAELAKGPATGLSVTATDGEVHKRLQAPIRRMLAPERVAKAAPLIGGRVEELLDGFAGAPSGQVDVAARFTGPLAVLVILDLLGVDEADRDRAMHACQETVLWLADDVLPEDVQIRTVKETVALQHLLADYVRRRHAEPRDDLFSEAAAAFAGDSGLDDEAVADAITPLWTLIMAGHATTADGLATAVRHLLTHRDQWELLCAKPEMIPPAVEELLRYDTPTHSFFRVTTQSVTLGGVQLDAGAELLIVYGSANRDESRFEHPAELDVTHPPDRHLSFAHGIHYCLGAELARLEMRIALTGLTRRLPGLRLVPGQTFEYAPNIRVRGPRQVLVTW